MIRPRLFRMGRVIPRSRRDEVAGVVPGVCAERHGVAGQRGQRVGHRGHHADHAEGGVLDHGQAVVAAEDLAPHELDARAAQAERLELLDFVRQAADLGLFHFHRAQLGALLDQQAHLMAYVDNFFLFGMMAVCTFPLIFLFKRVTAPAKTVETVH